ncbi:hypothetical protein D9757_008330 [Collybiopsis confluens]|uniref:Uncharacterized protein n=1 Tax=Collybiopsis confluens TaxID=2823264 RepID=A0A8H5HEK2_9AGAR|nr:hypothetical protein D9757_008330 [Collybiopsis confluens]
MLTPDTTNKILTISDMWSGSSHLETASSSTSTARGLKWYRSSSYNATAGDHTLSQNPSVEPDGSSPPINNTSRHLHSILAADRHLLDGPSMQWEAQLLNHFSGHIIAPPDKRGQHGGAFDDP